ncbi:energy-coupling factor transporter transmembrane component T [Clostridium botulinum]|uniref:Transmembrane protein n=1 Tax=Clostridium botulinum (strain Hall / ATCC 3502 / NCTC 13319 / Type A) TaxID=441771 RepID=A5I3J9_CLOBH|nr:energy-coupling factor transporter transmembrane component T [Clostridium botulinum]ABS34257.1 putative ABC transporter, permease protein [Clostridium botulinum A str. ATCC 19397]ABS37523.1 putative ABC transporter, permease protein [Clostridium botulinum A str. Hall]AWB17942.1 energy-coupling factor transporter transmembrane protein EcfT [Clostridium botulinum]AWB30723.1 energy-coupling factor transporter transmembrane protein EcfT [Clostridium botulinum]EGT5614412.1 energy-coupling factor
MINYIALENKGEKGVLKIDPRTKIILMILGNVAIFLAFSIQIKISLIIFYLIFGFLCGAYKSPIKISLGYFGLILVEYLGGKYLSGTLALMIVTFSQFVKMILPCALLASIMISTTKVSEFMGALNKMRVSKKVIIPLTVMIRYFPVVFEDWKNIKDSMRMRDVSPTFLGFLKNPSDTIECIYVPMLMSASKVSDELSAAAITRGIENPNPRTCMVKMKMKFCDYLSISLMVTVIVLEVLM